MATYNDVNALRLHDDVDVDDDALKNIDDLRKRLQRTECSIQSLNALGMTMALPLGLSKEQRHG